MRLMMDCPRLFSAFILMELELVSIGISDIQAVIKIVRHADAGCSSIV